MSKQFNLAVIGATGTIGETLVQLLEEREFPVKDLHLLAGNASAGQSVAFRGKNLRVRELEGFDFAQVQLVFFAASEAVTLAHAERARAAGCSVIDLSGALSDAMPIVPEANAQVLSAQSAPYWLSSPVSLATALAAVLAPLRASLVMRKLVVHATLSASAFGREGVAELARQTTELLNMRPLETKVLDRQLAFNLLAQVGTGEQHTAIEVRAQRELKQLLALPELSVSLSCALAPVFFGDSVALSLQTDSAIDLSAVAAVLEAQAGLELVEAGDYPTVVGDAVGQDELYIGRLRTAIEDASELNLWIASDNVRKGSALNAVQIGELLIKGYL